MKRALIGLLLLATATACSQSNHAATTSAGGSPTPVPSNATGFPLFAESQVLASNVVHQTVNARSYDGVEVVAQTPATMAQLSQWLKGLSASPPPGYEPGSSVPDSADAHRHAQALGVDYQFFTHAENGAKHVVVVLAVDPTTFNEKAGPVLGMIQKYKMLPQSLRDPIDAQVKSRTGYTVGDALSPGTPIGAALAAIDQLRTSGQRGVVVVDGVRK